MDSRVLFVAEAPGRLGADRTGIPLYGDRTGENFQTLLANIGWERKQVFITNAILCNPKQENGNNGTPTAEEILNCSAYLEMIVTLVDPDVVVALGATALSALDLLSPHGTELSQGVARPLPWLGRLLFPLYHPAPRAMIHRSLAKQRSDFMRLAKLVHPVKGLSKRLERRERSEDLFSPSGSVMQHVARVLLELSGRMTYFKMTKLMYLIDLVAVERLGQTVASNIYLRQMDGPWPPELDGSLRSMEGYEVRRFSVRNIPMVAVGPSPRFEVHLDDRILEIVSDVFDTYGSMTNAQIKRSVYTTEPMRFILRAENKGTNMHNKPVLYKDKTARELAEDETQRGRDKRM
jgi:uracil-DNA glycosylase family 4